MFCSEKLEPNVEHEIQNGETRKWKTKRKRKDKTRKEVECKRTVENMEHEIQNGETRKWKTKKEG